MKGGFGPQFALAVLQKCSRWRSSHERGFTVIEVLIVLAVTGALFTSAALLISGRQRQTQFNQSIRQIQSQIQQAINEVAIGYYSDANSFRCTATATGPSLTAAGSTDQGTNSGCIFLGKALQFRVAGSDPEQFATYTVAGLQKRVGSEAEVVSLAEARPRVSESLTSRNTPMPGGLTTTRMWYNNGSDVNVGAVAFVSSLAQYSSGSIVSGSQQVNVVPIGGTLINRTKAQTETAINSNLDNGTSAPASPVNPTRGVFMCFVSGGTNQSGLISIGNNGRQLSVTLTIKSNTTCA